MRKLLALLAAILLSFAIAWIAGRPPAAKPASARPTEFSAARAMTDVRRLGAAPRPTGSAANAAARDYLVRRLRAMGLEVYTQAVTLSPEARARLQRWGLPNAVDGHNIVAVLQGRGWGEPAVGLMAHYDSVPGSPGAADDAAGVAAILETVRALKAPGRLLARDVMVILTDAEELNLDGAKAFFGRHPLASSLGVVVNLEARGGGGRALMFETGAENGAMIEAFRRAVGSPSANSTAVMVYRLMPNSSDVTVAKARLPVFNFAFMGRAAQYHSPSATPGRLHQGALQHIGGQALDLARALAQAQTLPPRAPDAVFSDVLGLFVIAYAAPVGWALIALVLLLIGYQWMVLRPKPGAVLAGAAAGLAMLVTAGVLLHLANLLSGPSSGYFDRLAAIPRLEVQAVLLSLAAAALVLARGRPGPWGGWIGLMLLALGLTAVLQLRLPAATPVFAWPLLLCAVAGAAAARLDLGLGRPWTRPVLALVLAVGAAQTLGLAHLAFLGVGPDLPAAMAPFALIALMLLWPLAAMVVKGRAALVVALACLVGAAGIALWVRFDPMAATVPTYL